MPGPEPLVAKKADLTIFLAGSQLLLQDANDGSGGAVEIQRGKSMAWQNRTGVACRLTFFRLQPADDDAGDRVPYWPFDETEPRDCVKEMPARSQWKPRLREDLDPAINVKYDVAVPGLSYVPVLDPVIIVKP